MKKLLWGVPAIAVYFYAATVLTAYGFISYFDIPSSFVKASLSDNIIYFHQLLVALRDAAKTMHFGVWIFIAVVIALIAWAYTKRTWRRILAGVGTIAFLLLLLIGFPKFGTALARHTVEFFVPEAGCFPVGEGVLYIVPEITDGRAVFVPINENNKLAGGFLVMNLGELPCRLERRNIGKVVR